MKKTKADIKRLMKIQFVLLFMVIAIGAIIFGFNTNNWILTAKIAAGMLTAITAFAPLIYNKAVQNAELFIPRK